MARMTPGLGQPPAPTRPSRAMWLALAILLIGTTMSVLNSTIVNVALPTIRTSLDTTDAALSWIMSGWALAFGISFIPAGRLGDRLGHKWIFVVGVAVFTITSAACGLAQSEGQLIAFRVVQGLSGGLFFPTVSIYIQLMFTGRARGTAYGVMGVVLGVASAIGPLVGGLLIQAFGQEDGWRFVFFVNLPLGVIAAVAGAWLLPGDMGTRSIARGFDVLGTLLLAASLSAVLVPLIEGRARGWPAWTWMLLAGGVGLLAVFAVWERHLDRSGRLALVPPRLYRHPSFSAGTGLALLFYAAFVSIFYALSILWQTGLGFSALDTGLLSAPFAAGTIAAACSSGYLTHHWGRGVLLAGTGSLTAGLGIIWVLLSTLPATSLSPWHLAGPLLLAGLGCGSVIGPNAQFIVATVDRSEAGAAGGVTATMQRVGTAIGTAVVGSVLFGTLDFPSRQGPPTADDVAVAFTHSVALSIGVCTGLAFLAFVLVFALPRQLAGPSSPHQTPPASEPTQPATATATATATAARVASPRSAEPDTLGSPQS
jgi:EmrB/QacA subfamily drug resistance transporter